MNTKARTTARSIAPWLWLALGALVVAGVALRPASAQEAPAAVEIASADELAELVGPIALYPDDLVAIVLPASTYPLQIVQAARFLEERKRDSSLQADPDWDDSIVALLNYPEVVDLLNDDLDWTYDLGAAVLNQRADVLNAIQSFRDEAYAAGNLRSDERQTVTRDDGAIAIKPADPQVIYVPYYEPERVVIYQPVPVYYYYPRRYPVYYYPYPAHYVFDTGFFWGVRSWFSIGWHSHHVHVYDWSYHSHPYFGWSYYDPFYVRNVYVNVNVNRDYVWEPRYRYGGRPVVRGYEGRVYTGDTPPARVSRGVAGSAYRNRTTEGSAGAVTTEPNRVSRGVAGSAYRNRDAGTTAEDGAGSSATQRRQPNVDRGGSAQPTPAAPTEGGYRGRGMSQALEGRAQAPQSGAAPPRASQQSTGIPREASRGAEMRTSPQRAAPTHEPSGGGSAAPRGDGSYRGNAGSSRGGESSGRGQQHQPVRGGEGRSAGR
jgi:hypothetical protein